jgi:hypothetical protein
MLWADAALPAVNDQLNTGDKFSLIGSQKKRRICRIPPLSRPSQCNAACTDLPHLFQITAIKIYEHMGHRGVHISRQDAVYSNVFFRLLHGHTLDELVDGRLTDAILYIRRSVFTNGGKGRYIDDCAPHPAFPCGAIHICT